MLSAILLTLQVPQPAMVAHNPAATAQDVVLVASLPLPRHWHALALADLTVGGEAAAWTPLLRWPDGGLALVQVHWRAHLPPASSSRLPVHCEPVGDDGAAGATTESTDDGWPSPLPLRTELVDPWGRTHIAHLQPQESHVAGLRRVQTFAGTHVEPESGTGLLGVRVTFVHVVGEDHGELTLVLDNGRCGDSAGLGPVRFSRFSLVTEDARLRLRPRWAAENLLQPPSPVAGQPQCHRQDLLGPSPFLYLGDATAKAFCFDVAWDVGGADAQAALGERIDHAPSAFADLDWVRSTGAFGLHGGPAPLAGPLDDMARVTVGLWRAQAEFGPFGSFGEPKEAVALGSSRNGPSALHNVLRWQSVDLVRMAQARVLQDLLRPLPGRLPHLPEATRALRQGLSTRATQQPHGFEALEYEGISVDLLFDYWWLTGDPVAHDELRRQGQAIRALLERLPFLTSRGEGWCMQALVAVARATADAPLLEWTRQRVRTRLLPRLADSRLVALPQPPHPEALGGAVPFDAPWQMAALVHGLDALYRATEDDAVAAAAVEVARRMATHGWHEGQGPKYLMHATEPQMFCMPRGYAPLQGTAWFELGAFVLAGELVRDDSPTQHLLAQRAQAIAAAAGDRDGTLTPAVRANPWLQLWLDRRARRD